MLPKVPHQSKKKPTLYRVSRKEWVRNNGQTSRGNRAYLSLSPYQSSSVRFLGFASHPYRWFAFSLAGSSFGCLEKIFNERVRLPYQGTEEVCGLTIR